MPAVARSVMVGEVQTYGRVSWLVDQLDAFAYGGRDREGDIDVLLSLFACELHYVLACDARYHRKCQRHMLLRCTAHV